jgi:hypothetical protein
MRDFLDAVLAKLLDLWGSVRSSALQLFEDFRKSNKYFKYKTAVIAGYVVIAVLTLVIFIPGGELNQIDAEVTLNKAEIIGGRYFLVSNLSTKEWKDISLTLNNTYTARHDSLGGGKKMPFYLSAFVDRMSRPPSVKIVVQTLRIECNRGIFERDFIKHP